MADILKIIFGDFTWVQLIGYGWFFVIGYILYALIEVSGRNPSSPSTPVKFSFKFWFLDNWKRYITTIVCSYILFRFYNEISGHDFGNIDALILGTTGDGLAATIKKRIKSFTDDRQKLMVKMTLKKDVKDVDAKDGFK